MAAVREHLATCPESHAEFEELGGVVPYLLEIAGPRAGRAAGRARRPDHGRGRGRPRRADARRRADDPRRRRRPPPRTHRAGRYPVPVGRGARRPRRADPGAAPARSSGRSGSRPSSRSSRSGRGTSASRARSTTSSSRSPRPSSYRTAVTAVLDVAAQPGSQTALLAPQQVGRAARHRGGRVGRLDPVRDAGPRADERQPGLRDVGDRRRARPRCRSAASPSTRPGSASFTSKQGPDGRRASPSRSRASRRPARRRRPRSCRRARRRRPRPSASPRSISSGAAALAAAAPLRARPAPPRRSRRRRSRRRGSGRRRPRPTRGRPPISGSSATPSRTRRATVAPAEPGRHEDELVAAEAGDGVDEPDRAGEDGRDRAEHVVAGFAAAGLVRRREVVDVEDRDRDLAALPAGPGELELEDAGERPLVREAGQRVGVGEPLEPLAIARRPSRRAASDRRRPRPGRPSPAGTRHRPRSSAGSSASPAEEHRAEALLDPAPADDQRVRDAVVAGSISARSRAAAVSGWSADATAATRAAWPASSSPTVNVELRRPGRSGSWRLIAALVRADGGRGRADERLERLVEVGAAGQRLGTGGERRRGHRVAGSRRRPRALLQWALSDRARGGRRRGRAMPHRTPRARAALGSSPRQRCAGAVRHARNRRLYSRA